MSNIAEIEESFSRLLKKDATWNWGPEQQSSFDRIKEMLSDKPVRMLLIIVLG